MKATCVGNILPEVKALYDNLTKKRVSNHEFTKLKTGLTKKILGKFVPADQNLYEMSSLWFIERSKGCDDWHIDGQKSMVICSYPYPVQIFETDIHWKTRNTFVNCNSPYIWRNHTSKCKEDLINELISNKNGRIITPNLGDVYILENRVIHRTNPAAFGNSHLCLRIWYGGAVG